MKAAIRSSALARIFLVAGFGVALSAMPANAQKAGGSITVGLEVDIPGFDPLKVGVYDTAVETAAAAIFDTLVALDDNGKPVPKLALSWTHSDDYKTWTFKLGQASNSTTARLSMRKRSRKISIGRKTLPTNAAVPFTSPMSTTCRRPMS